MVEGVRCADLIVRQEPTPAPFVGDMKDSAQFYTNRVIKEYKDS